jgi:hypothetical protein
MAPTCTICLLRKDKASIWCEVTSSIRTVEYITESTALEATSDDGKGNTKLNLKAGLKSEEGSSPSEVVIQLEKELLLCLRPIQDVKELRFGRHKKKDCVKLDIAGALESTKPPKKRHLEDACREEEPSTKKPATAPPKSGNDTPTKDDSSFKVPAEAMREAPPDE